MWFISCGKESDDSACFGLEGCDFGAYIQKRSSRHIWSRVTRFAESSRDVAAGVERGGAEPSSVGGRGRSLAEGAHRRSFPERVKNAPAARHVRRPALSASCRRGSSGWKVLRSHLRCGRSRVCSEAISARARGARLPPGQAFPSASRHEVSVARRARASAQPCARSSRQARPIGTGASCTVAGRPRSSDHRHSVSPGWRAGSRVTRGRARVSSRSADSRRASRASARSFESKAFRIPRSAGPFTRAPLEAGIGARQRVTRRQAHAAARAPGTPETALTNTKPEQDSGSATRGGGGSGQHAVKRAAHARAGRSGTRTSR